jgi:hypothetical protein
MMFSAPGRSRFSKLPLLWLMLVAAGLACSAGCCVIRSPNKVNVSATLDGKRQYYPAPTVAAGLDMITFPPSQVQVDKDDPLRGEWVGTSLSFEASWVAFPMAGPDPPRRLKRPDKVTLVRDSPEATEWRLAPQVRDALAAQFKQ